MAPKKRPRSRKRTARPADVYTRIRAALPNARAVIADGIDPVHPEIYNLLPDLPGLDDDHMNQVSEVLDAAYLLGIAVGLLLSPEILTAKGGR